MALASRVVYLASMFYIICGAQMSVLGQQQSCRENDYCGFNGICHSYNYGSPNCSCPPGFHFVDYANVSKGCFRIPPQLSCSQESWMQDIGTTDWPGNDYDSIENISEGACKQVCLEDCFCIVSVFGFESGVSTCWKKAMPLRRGFTGADRTTFVKISKPSKEREIPAPSQEPWRKERETSAPSQEPWSKQREKSAPNKEKKRWVLVAIGSSLLGCSFILATFSVIVCLRGSRKLKVGQEQHELTGDLKSFKYIELERATGYFKEELGRGASGKVYKGTLPDGRAVAVKKLKKIQGDSAEMSEKVFGTEMSIIAACRHKNLVQIYGFCDEGCHRLLVYELMSNGSLDKAIFQGSDYLDWNLRVQIVLGTARGILYLHEECQTQILHCDIKPQNILLDKKYKAKISDFGIAKLFGAEQTRTFTAARGTLGYIAPEWNKNMAITAKVDVYSFGVTLLEIICCRKTMELNKPDNEIILCEWVYDCLRAGRLEKLVEQQLSENQDEIDLKEMERMVLVGLWCIQEDPSLRPSSRSVVQMLEGKVEMTVPPNPVISLE